jgi:hypothetical protein
VCMCRYHQQVCAAKKAACLLCSGQACRPAQAKVRGVGQSKRSCWQATRTHTGSLCCGTTITCDLLSTGLPQPPPRRPRPPTCARWQA